VRERLVDPQHRVPQRPFRRPAIQRILTSIDGLHDSLDECEVVHIVIQIDAADGELRRQACGIHNQNGKQKQQGQGVLAGGLHSG
jgi:hypothetical protein